MLLRLSLTVATGLASLVGLCQAGPLIYIRQEVANSTDLVSLDSGAIHANIQANFPANKIILSTDLDAYLAAHAVELQAESVDDRTIYLSDTQTFITLETIPAGNETLEARQGSCLTYGQTSLLATHEYWSPWQHLSSCGFSSAGQGGSVTYQTAKSISVSYGGGIAAADPFKAILQVAFSFSITYSHEITTGYSCNFGANDVGQVWGRHRMGWAAVQNRVCNTCSGACTDWKTGWVDSPASDDTTHEQFGCSTASRSHLRCS